MSNHTRTPGIPSDINDGVIPRSDADVELIAAAPDLLAAANRIIEGLANGGEIEGLPSGTPVSVPIDDIYALVQAVAKAEGNEK